MKSLSLTILAVLLMCSNLLIAQESYKLVDSKMTVSGTSTLHEWESDVTDVNIQASLTFTDGQLQAIPSMSVRIPVKGIKSSHGKMMDNKTYGALKSDAHPNVTFQLQSATIKDKNNLTATGKLTVAGVSKTVKFPVSMKASASGKITFSGKYSLLMSDYKMEAPTALMGSVKTGDEVTIAFTCTLEPTKATANSK